MKTLNQGSRWLTKTLVAEKEHCIQHILFAFIMDPYLLWIQGL